MERFTRYLTTTFLTTATTRRDVTLTLAGPGRNGLRMRDTARMIGRPWRKVTFCRICEAYCGMVAEVDGDRLVSLRPDRDHPLSRGYACPKGIAMAEVHNDPERVLHPLRRQPDGSFERVSWESAITDIGAWLNRIPRDGVRQLAGMAHLNGIAVSVTPARPTASAAVAARTRLPA